MNPMTPAESGQAAAGRLRPGWAATINDLTLASRSFRADAFGSRLRLAASTHLFASAFVQYVKSTDELVANVRLNYIHAPLSDVFLVFTERRDLERDMLTERVLTLKITKLLTF